MALPFWNCRTWKVCCWQCSPISTKPCSSMVDLTAHCLPRWVCKLKICLIRMEHFGRPLLRKQEFLPQSLLEEFRMDTEIQMKRIEVSLSISSACCLAVYVACVQRSWHIVASSVTMYWHCYLLHRIRSPPTRSSYTTMQVSLKFIDKGLLCT